VVPGSNRLLSLAAAVGSIALLAVVIFMLWPADPSDTAMADRDQVDGEAIGCISTVAYNDAFGFLGFYIVRPEYRSRGYGIQIWNAGMA